MSSETDHAAMTVEPSGIKNPYFFVPHSFFPVLMAFSAMFVLMGIIFAAHFGSYILLVLAVLSVLSIMFFWWRKVVAESEHPTWHSAFDLISLRYGMTLFIASEVMFFVGFFWAFFNFALFPEQVPDAPTRSGRPTGIHTFDPFSLPVPQHDDPAAVRHDRHLGASRADRGRPQGR